MVKIGGNSRGGALGVNLLLITGGAVLIVSGIRNRPLIDVATGKDLGTPTTGVPASSVDVGGGRTAADILAGAGELVDKPITGTTIMDGKPVANWIYTELQWARKHGWTGRVTSGMRTKAQQLAAAASFGMQHYPHGPLASNHYIGNGTAYPHGAVDVTNDQELIRVLRSYPGGSRLRWYGPGDSVHFSATGR